MAARECPRCTRPVADAGTVCHGCLKETRRALHQVARLWPTLQEAIAKRTRMGVAGGGKATKRAAEPLPVDLRASAVADSVRATLVGWVRVLAEDHGLALPPDRVPAFCGWLADHGARLRAHEAAVEACDEICRCVGAVVRAVDYPADRATIKVGPCPETVEAEPCAGTVWAVIPHEGHGAPRLECKSCGGVWDSTQWARMGDRVRRRRKQLGLQASFAPVEVAVSPAMAAALIGVSTRTVQRMVRDGRLAANGGLVSLRAAERLRRAS